MKKRLTFLLFFLFLVGTVFTPNLRADEEDSVPSTNIGLPQNEDSSIFDETRIHVGVSLIHSMQNFLIAPGTREIGGIKGFQLALGIDLFSPNWIAEAIVMNFPQNSISDTSLSMTGFELRFLYERPVLYGLTLHGGVGLANRFYNIQTQNRLGTNVIAQNESFNSGATVLAFGADYWPSGDVSGGVEITNHLPMATGDDPSSIDFSVKLTGHF